MRKLSINPKEIFSRINVYIIWDMMDFMKFLLFIMWYEMRKGCTRDIRIPVIHAEKYVGTGNLWRCDAHRWLQHTTIIDYYAKAHVRNLFPIFTFCEKLAQFTVKLPYPLIFLQKRRGIIYIFLRSEGQRPLKALRGHEIMIRCYCFWLFIHANVALKHFNATRDQIFLR